MAAGKSTVIYAGPTKFPYPLSDDYTRGPTRCPYLLSDDYKRIDRMEKNRTKGFYSVVNQTQDLFLGTTDML